MTLGLSSENRWTLLAIALAAAIGVVDALTPGQTLIGLLVVPPLVASTAVRPSRTCWIAFVCLLEALALGAPDRIWMTQDHVIRIAEVLGAGSLAVLLAMGRRSSERSLTAAYRISQAAQTSASLQDLFKAIHAIVGELMPARNFYIALCDAECTEITFPYFVDEFDAPPAPKPPGRGLTEYVLRSGEPLLGTPEVFDDLVRRGEVESIGAPSIDWLGVPLKVEGRTIGVLVVQSYSERVRYTERQRRALEFVSTQVAMAIERGRHEEALRQSEERYRALADATMEAVVIHEDGRVLEVNPAFLRLFGYDDAREVVGRSIFDFGTPESAAPVAAAVRSGRETPYEAVGLRKDGTTFLGELAGRPATYRGRQVRMTAIHDITERRRAEAALRASEARLSQAQAIAHLGVWELDLTNLDDVNANPLWWSDETFRIFGYEPGRVSVTNDLFFSAVAAADRPRIQEAVRRAVSEGLPYYFEHRVARPDGTERSVREQATVVRDATGRPVRMMGTVLDVTEQRRLEEQLRQAQKMDAVGQLAGGLAHDFNNLLTTILTMCQMLKSELPPDATVQGDLDAIRGAAEHGSELTRKLLAFSRHQRLEMRSVAVEMLVREFLRMARRVVPEDVEVDLAVEADGATVVADPAALEQILMNLVTNARDAMPTGGRMRIEVSRASLDAEDSLALDQGAPGEYVVLSVHDTGEGMDAETQRRMFEPFFTTKPVGKGTGLGMPIVYGLVKEHNGFVRTYSEVGQGTTVRVYLPAAAQRASAPRPSSADARGGSETILLVEDDEALRRSGTRVLTRYGYTVVTARDGREALEIVRSAATHPDLIVSDVVMPHAGGPELLRALRDAGVSAKVLFTSGYPARDVHERTPLEPGVPFLAKPWTIQELVRRVREILDAPEERARAT
ncbi:MAG TPA: PAS domain S-box protein [Gemmatimonadales bacterium]|nr:PAS domain S-box protein [Gemmatimonadales bacterium]